MPYQHRERSWFHSLAAATCAAAATALLSCSPATDADSAASSRGKPNIIIILADDLGYGDLGVTGAPDIATPRLDRLAAEGVRFTRAYANAPVCSPTRAALLTGRYQQRSGVDRVIYVSERDQGMTLDAVLLPELLKQAGYATGIVGKWHLGYPKQYFPTRRGFDEFVGFVAGNIDYFSHTDGLDIHDLWRNEQEIGDERYFTDLIADEAISFISRRGEQPFFLYCAFNAPHAPFQTPEHRHTAGDQEITRRVNRTREVFRGMVESLDQNIGRILDHLSEEGLDENTAVFFLSDNGGLPVVARNAPFRGYKGSLWEGGLRSPLIARWTGRFQAGTLNDEMVAGMDLFPTALAIAGVSVPPDLALDGVNLLPTIERGEKLGRDSLYFHYNPSRRNHQHAVIEGDWKYYADAEGVEHLFHLSEDPGEANDLAREDPERLERMKEAFASWKEEVFRGAPRQPERP